MKLTIGRTIYKLRKEKGITQEQLAAAVGVSTSAVSKWENESVYPDITLLTPIARFLDTTIDELMDYQNQLPMEEVPKIGRKSVEVFENSGFMAGLDYCKKRVFENPNCPILKYHLAMIIYQYLADSGKDEQQIGTKTAIAWLEQSSKIEKPLEIKLASLHYLGQYYMVEGEFEKAQRVFENLPKDLGMDFTNDLAASYLEQDKNDEVEEICQRELYINVSYAFSALSNLCTVARLKENYEDALQLLKLQQQLISLFQMESYLQMVNYGLFVTVYTDMQNEDETLNYLEKAIESIPEIGRKKIEDIKFFQKMKQCTSIASAESMKRSMKNMLLVNDYYDFIKNTDRYKAIMSKLSE